MKNEQKENIRKILENNFSLNEIEVNLVDQLLSCENANFDRIGYILNKSVAFKLDKSSIMAFLSHQLFKLNPEKADEISSKMPNEEKEMINNFKIIKDINALTVSENIDDIRRMFIVMSKDMRVVILKLFGICYDISILKLPLTDIQWNFVKQVKEIHIPLAERLGLDKLKLELNDNVVRLEYPEDFAALTKEIEDKREENERQLSISKEKIVGILDELKINGKIESRIKHISSIFNKLHNKNISLDKIYDILAIRVIVNTVEECYAVMGKIHGIYRPMLGRVKDYIASPKPNGYKSLHTTIIAENQHPLEIQIRTESMHRESEFGVYAHYLYKEKKDKESEFDKKISWFRQTIENAKDLSDEEFIQTLKSDLYNGIIVVQTPKGKVLELPQGSCVIDFAYAIHTDIGNKCVGAKINNKIKPITTMLVNGDIVEILTNTHSKGPSRDWLKVIKTSGARSKIKSFFKNELKEENIKLGKTILHQAVADKGLNATQLTEEKYLNEILKKFNVETLDEIYAGIGSGSISSNQVANKFQSLVRTDDLIIKKDKNYVTLKRNKDGVLVDGDSGMLVRFAGCCNPIEGDDIVGYISHGKGVTIHRSNCNNIRFYEKERLINAEWQYKEDTTFTAQIHVVALKSDNNIGRITNLITGLKINIKGFDAKDVGDRFLCLLIVDVKNKDELENVIKQIKNLKNILEVYRSEK